MSTVRELGARLRECKRLAAEVAVAMTKTSPERCALAAYALTHAARDLLVCADEIACSAAMHDTEEALLALRDLRRERGSNSTRP